MEAIVPVILIAGVLIVVIIVVQQRMAAKRREQYREFATRHGWNYQEEDATYVNRWEGKPFDSGRGRKAMNVLSGVHHGWSVVVFEHRHQTTSSNGQSSSTQNHWHMVWVVTLPGPLPRLQVTPWGPIRGKLAEWFGMQDIKVGDEEFDQYFRVQSGDEGFVHSALGPSMIHALRQADFEMVRIDGNELVYVERGRLVPEESASRLDHVITLASQLPTR